MIKLLLEQKRPKQCSIKVYSNVIKILDIASINKYFIPAPLPSPSPKLKARFSLGNRLYIKSLCSV